MKKMKISSLQKAVAVSTLLVPTLSVFAPPSTAASTVTTQEIQTSTLASTSFQNEGVYQLAQSSGKCLEVGARNGVHVREEPTVYSRALGILPQGRNVTVVDNPGSNVVVGNPGAEWMPISSPVQGYVFARFLTSCQSSPPPQNCREVSARGGLAVRRESSINSAVVGVVANGRNLTIENRGVNGWVPISAPLQGYVSAAYLTYCP